MAALEVLALNTVIPQIQAPQVGDSYLFPRVAEFSAGTALLPSITRNTDLDTGMWFPAANTVAWSTAGLERMRISSAGAVGLGASPLATTSLFLGGTYASGSALSQAVRVGGTFPASTTTTAESFLSRPVTATATYTLDTLIHFHAHPDDFGVGSTVTNQYGFYADNTITAATNNYGFYSAIASGSGRWNFYAAGTANNYFGGSVGINEAAPDYKLDVNGTFGFTPGSSVTPVDNGDVVFEATNNTTFTIKLKGSDGIVRTGAVTLA